MKLLLLAFMLAANPECFGQVPLFHAAGPRSLNTNPNYAKVREYGSIEWDGPIARLIAGGSRPLDMAAQTLSSCLFLSVSAEDAHYRWLDDLIEVTSPEWAAQHPGHHAYAPKPASVNVPFNVGADGMPLNLNKLLDDAVEQVNRQQPWRFRVEHDFRHGQNFYAFVPTASHDDVGHLQDMPAWLDHHVTIPSGTAPVMKITGVLTSALTAKTGYYFYCCQPMVIGDFWGTVPLAYDAANQSARNILQDMMIAAAGTTSYVLRCEPTGRSCWINLTATQHRIPPTAPQSGRCSAFGYQPE